MPMLDVFNNDAFNMVSLTASLNLMPYRPKRLGDLGLFQEKGLRTTTAVVEEREGKLSVLQTAARGTTPTVDSEPRRKSRAFTVPHIPKMSEVMADDVQNVRSFGSETEMETVAEIVNNHLQQHSMDHETTFEWHRMGAIKGQVLDADGTLLLDLFTAFEATPVTISFELATPTTELKNKCTEVLRAMEDALGADEFTEVRVFCGDSFWDKFIVHPTVKESYERWRDGEMLRTNQYRQEFPFAGLVFENYRGKIGGAPWMETDRARCVARGVPELFLHHMSPAPYIETVNTNGIKMYAKQERMKLDMGTEIHSNSNPLIMCTRPKTLIELTE